MWEVLTQPKFQPHSAIQLQHPKNILEKSRKGGQVKLNVSEARFPFLMSKTGLRAKMRT